MGLENIDNEIRRIIKQHHQQAATAAMKFEEDEKKTRAINVEIFRLSVVCILLYQGQNKVVY